MKNDSNNEFYSNHNSNLKKSVDPKQSFKSRSINFSHEGNDIENFLEHLKNENESQVDMYPVFKDTLTTPTIDTQ